MHQEISIPSPVAPGSMQRLLLVLVLGVACATASSFAQALPSFAQQTGMDCAACHVGGFGPQLTSFGMRFKIRGYTDSNGKSGNIPLAAMMMQTFTHIDEDLPEDPAPHFSNNDNFALQELSAFLAGGFGQHLGAIVQGTWSEIGREMALDNMDVRATNQFRLMDKSVVAGISLNNNPTVQDPLNDTPAWRFPFNGPELASEQAGGPLIDGGLEQQVFGLTAYTLVDDSIYIEAGAYRSPSQNFLEDMNIVGKGELAPKIDGLAPYWRVAYMKDLDGQSYSVGVFGMMANLEPDRMNGLTDGYEDVGVDATYQYYKSPDHFFALDGAYIHEARDLNATFLAGGADRTDAGMEQVRLTGSYYYRNTYGLTGEFFDTWGGRDATLYGTRTGRPDTDGVTLQADWTPLGKAESWNAPWVNVRLGLQYTMYGKFNGASSNYEDTGRDAGDNDTLFGFLWGAF